MALRLRSSLSGAFWLVGSLVVNVVATNSTTLAGVRCVGFHEDAFLAINFVGVAKHECPAESARFLATGRVGH